MERLTNVRCTSCGRTVADRIVIERGWIERQCRNCGAVFHAGQRRGPGPIRDVTCPGERRHKVAEASHDWLGELESRCRKCRPTLFFTVTSGVAPPPSVGA